MLRDMKTEREISAYMNDKEEKYGCNCSDKILFYKHIREHEQYVLGFWFLYAVLIFLGIIVMAVYL